MSSSEEPQADRVGRAIIDFGRPESPELGSLDPFVCLVGDGGLVADHLVGLGVADRDQAEVFAGGWMIIVAHADGGGDDEGRLPGLVFSTHNGS